MKNTLAALCCSAALLAAPAWAQESEVKYQLEIEAPEELRDVLRQGLQIGRWNTDLQMTPELLRRLADEAVREATVTSAAYGYFSARVSYQLDRDSTPWRILLQVEPGERTHVIAAELASAARRRATPRRPR